MKQIFHHHKREKTDIDDPKLIYRKLFYEIIDNISIKFKCQFENSKEMEFLELPIKF